MSTRAFVVAAATATCSAIDNGFTRPPLGWSALYGAPFSNVNEEIVQGAAAGLASGGWASAGYEYVVLDDWYAERGPDGRMRGTNTTFPHGLRATSDYIHSLGLKFGVYSAASQRTCGNFSASQYLEPLDADTFANDWQIDWLKYDSCYYSNGVASRSRYVTMRDALNATGRQIFYSMEGQAYFPDVGNMVRTGGDIWPEWDKCVLRNLYSNNANADMFVAGNGFFNDPDMLQATGNEGGGGLTFDEARSQFVLWAVMKAPLILGAHWSLLGNMSVAQPDYFYLLTHPELIAINQDISPQATLRQSMPSALQQVSGVWLNVTMQACTAGRYDQQWVPSGAAGIRAAFGDLCVALAPGSSAVLATPCDNSTAQGWAALLQDSQFHVVPSSGAAGMCLDSSQMGAAPSAAPCEYSGPLPPPFTNNIGDQLWVWDRFGAIVHGSSGLCLTLGLPPVGPATVPYSTNNGTLQSELWGGSLSSGKTVAVLFNKATDVETLTFGWDALGLGLRAGASLPVRDVYAREDLGDATTLSAQVQPHGVRVFVIG